MLADYITLQMSERAFRGCLLVPQWPSAPVSPQPDRTHGGGGRREGSEPLRETRGSLQPPPSEVRLFPDRNGYGSYVEKILF